VSAQASIGTIISESHLGKPPFPASPVLSNANEFKTGDDRLTANQPKSNIPKTNTKNLLLTMIYPPLMFGYFIFSAGWETTCFINIKAEDQFFRIDKGEALGLPLHHSSATPFQKTPLR
jgi:hypothetical protein